MNIYNKKIYKIIYKTNITELGKDFYELYEQAESIVLFSDEIKDYALREISILHRVELIDEPIQVGDIIFFEDKGFEIMAIGDYALDSLRKIGHCTIKFNGKNRVELSGEITVPKGEIDFYVGMSICVCRKA